MICVDVRSGSCLSDFCCRKPEISVLIWPKCSSILDSIEIGVDVKIA